MNPRRCWREFAIAAVLLAVMMVVYAPVRHFGFIDYDDYSYVSRNPHVLAGLNSDSVRWAFRSTEFGNWFPLTWLSLMADRQFFASPDEIPPAVIRADAHHWTNVLLHGLATLLLFGILRRCTGATGPSAVAAFLFGLHPLHVESVAWVAERKDVLSAVFWMLALWSYVRYCARPKASTYLLTLLLYCLGFMAKPMVVTLPLVLVLFDIWPLRRFARRTLVWEKLPFYALAMVMSVVTYAVQKQGGAVRSLAELPMAERLANAVVAAVAYLGDLFWPAKLAVLYPLPAGQPGWKVMGAALLLAGLTTLAIRWFRVRPYFAAGWFWYLITLLPVIGIVQVGLQVRADRYTYIPMIGLSLIVAYGGAELWRSRPKLRPLLGAACLAASVGCVALTARQIAYWENSVTLFQHAIEVTGPNAFAHGYLGDVWMEQVMYDEAAAEYRQALNIAPHHVPFLVDLGTALSRSGRTAEALAPLAEAVRLQPGDPLIRNSLGAALAMQHREDDAIAQFQQAIRLKPDYADAHAALGLVLQRTGRIDEAIAQFTEALRIQPRNRAVQQQLEAAWTLKEHK